MHCSSGLSYSEAGKLNNFLYFSEPKNLKKKSILEIGDLNPAVDFLDVLSDDIPKGETAEYYILLDLLQVLKPLFNCMITEL